MPKRETIGQQANDSTLHTDVQPTKQANLIEPSEEAVESYNTTAEDWKPCRYKELIRAPFSVKPETYTVRIDGSAPERTHMAVSGPRKACTIETVVEAYHPYMAIGQAVTDFIIANIACQIDEVRIYRRVIKTIKPKK